MQSIKRYLNLKSVVIAIILSVSFCLSATYSEAYAEVSVGVETGKPLTAGKMQTLSSKVYKIGNLKYSVIKAPVSGKGTVKVVGVVNKKSTRLSIPAVITINGAQYQVVEIGKGAFKSWKKLKTASIPITVKTIRKDAFRYTSSLKKLVLKRSPTSTKFYKNALRGIGKREGKGLNICIPSATLKQVKVLLKANLKQHSKVNGYPLSGVTVKFNANKGIVSKKTKDVENFKKFGKLPTPKRNRYVFEGWFTKKNGGTQVTKSTLVRLKKDTTLYAQWYGPRGVGKTITRAEYDEIELDMSYSEVKFFIGGAGKSVYSYTRDEYVYDSHQEWVDTSYEYWVDDYEYDEFGNEYASGHYETVEDGYWQTIDDSYYEYIKCEGYVWYAKNGGSAYFDFEDGKLVQMSRYGF